MKSQVVSKNESAKLITFQESLYNFRKENNITQEEFAKRIGVKRTTVSSYENGTSYPDLKTLIKISSVTEKSINELIGIDACELNEEELKQKHFAIATGLSIGAVNKLYIFKNNGTHQEEIEALDYLIRYSDNTDDGASILKCLYDAMSHPELRVKDTIKNNLIQIYRSTDNRNEDYFSKTLMDKGEYVSMGDIYLLLLNKKINYVIREKIWGLNKFQNQLISKLKAQRKK